MICITDSTGITLKHTIDDSDHVRIGILQISLWVDGIRRSVRNIGEQYGKPGCEFTLNELSDLLSELRELQKCAQYGKAAKMTAVSSRSVPDGFTGEWDSTIWNVGFVFRWSDVYEVWLDCNISLTVKPGQALCEAFDDRMEGPPRPEYTIFFKIGQ